MTIQEAQAAVDQLDVGGNGQTNTDIPPEFTYEALAAKYQQEQEAQKPTYQTPKTWFGEGTAGLSRGLHELNQMRVGLGAIATPDSSEIHQSFLRAVKQQDEEIAASPATVPTYEGVHSFDSFMRYFAGGLGEMAPQIGLSVATGVGGAIAGGALGKASSAIGELIEKRAVASLVNKTVQEGVSDATKNELRAFATGQLEKKALSETAKSQLGAETANLAGKYGAWGAVASNSVGQEISSIYTDLENDPSIPETDKRFSAVVGGIIAAIPDAGFEGWIAGKFFKGQHFVPKSDINDAGNYLVRFAKTYGKELFKVIPAEGLQEGTQTLIEEAAKNYADPNKRDAIFSYTPEQWVASLDAAGKGAIGGVLGGGVSAIAETKTGLLKPHPDPAVRKDERDILGKTNDLAEPVPTKEDIQLSEITKRQEEINAELIKPDTEVTPEQKATLQEEHAKLEEEANTLLGKESPLVNDNLSETPPLSDVQTTENRPLQEGSIGEPVKATLNPLERYSKALQSETEAIKVPEREVFERIAPNVTPEEFTAKKEQVNNLVNEIVEQHPNKEEGAVFQQAMQKALPDEAVIMLADNGVNITKTHPGENANIFHVAAGPRGNITLRIPSIKNLLKQAKTLSEKSGIPITKGDRAGYLNATDSVMTHELFHVAQFVAERQQWIKDGKQGTFNEYHANNSVEIGKSLRALGKDFRFRELFKGLPTITQQVYNYGDFGSLDNQTLGDELPRMAAELARTGRIDEFTGALVRLQSESEGPKKGIISTFLQKWIQAIKSIQKVLAKLINPETSSQQFQIAFNNINKFLDNYGILVNDTTSQKAAEQQKELAKNKAANEDLQSETLETAIEKEKKKTDSRRELRENTERLQESKKEKGKPRDVREEASRPARSAEPVSEEPQKIIGTALNFGGEILRGPEPFSSHQEILAHHGGIKGVIKKTGEVPDLNKQGGFITEKGFVSRKEATEIAKQAGQIPQSYSGELHSQIINEQPKLAPNGKVSKLTPKQWNQVRTPQFKKWFGDWENDPENSSKTVDENGEPKVFWHGSLAENIEVFQVNDSGFIYFTDDKSHYVIQDSPFIYQAFLDIRNPITNKDSRNFAKELDRSSDPQTNFLLDGGELNGYEIGIHDGEFQNFAEENDRDGIILNDEYVVFGANQIKSATDNSGEFSTEDKGIARSAEPVFTKREEQLLNEAAESSNQIRQNQDVIVKASERQQRGSQQEFKNATPMDVNYQSQTNTDSYTEGQRIVNENGGAIKVAEELLKDPLGKKLKIVEDLHDPLNDIPNAKLTAVYESVRNQIGHHILPYLAAREAPTRIYNHVQDIWNRLRELFPAIQTQLGQATQYTGFDNKLNSGADAIESFKNTIINSAETVVGKKPREQFTRLSNRLNSLVGEKNAFTVANDPKAISILRKLIGLVNKSKFSDNYRKEVVQQIKKLKAILGPTSAKAAEALGNSDSSFAKADKVMDYLIKQMNLGGLKDEKAPDEHSVVLTALAKMARNIAKDMGLMEDNPKFIKLTPQEKMLAILKNEDLYTYFINGLREEQINKFGNEKDANELFQKMSQRMWEPDIVKSIVNEKLREINETFADIVKKDYEQGDFVKGNITEGIREYMKSNGVENQALVEELVNDIEKQFDENIKNAQEKFFASNKSLRDSLKFMGTTLAEAARDYHKYSENLQGSFADYLVEQYSFPRAEAEQMAKVMQKALNPLVNEQRTAILENYYKSWIKQQEAEKKRALNPNEIKKLKSATERILELSNLGVMRSEVAYRAIAEKFGLPEYSQEIADKIQELGDQIGESKSVRQADELKQMLANYITSVKGLPTSSSYLSWMYLSMLSGIGTLAVNAGGNFANLLGYLGVESSKAIASGNINKIPRMLLAMMRAASGSAKDEAKYSWFTGMQLGKDGTKFFSSRNPLELADVRFNSDTLLGKLGDRGKELDEKMAQFVHKLARGVKGQYIGRGLAATDMFFYKIAQEMAYAARVDGDLVGTPAMWASAKEQAREDMLTIGHNPDGTEKERNEFQVKSNAIFEQMRLEKNPEKVIASIESHHEALKTTFNQEPEYFLGRIQKFVEKILEGSIIGKAILPFTKISANVTNAMIEWTPFGIARYLLLQKGNPFKLMEDGKYKKDADIAIRAILGTGMMIALMALMKDDDEDPEGFTIYGDGPKDLEKKRLLMERGWKPHTFRLAGNYYSYLYMPWAMAFSIVGRRMDEHRAGHLEDPYSPQMAMDAVAMLQATMHQSFISSLTDLAGAIDSPNPEKKLGGVLARMSSIPIPNIVKQIDRWIDPSLQDAQGFTEMVIKELPFARHTLNNAVNRFGEPIQRTTTAIPGLERFITAERTNDELLNYLSTNNINLPGISKSTKINNQTMTQDQFYRYVQLQGPEFKKRLINELGSLRMMTKEQAEKRIQKIDQEEKLKAREILVNEK